jgi:hypothetical protein
MDYRLPRNCLDNSYPLTNFIVVKFARSVTSRQGLLLRPDIQGDRIMARI